MCKVKGCLLFSCYVCLGRASHTWSFQVFNVLCCRRTLQEAQAVPIIAPIPNFHYGVPKVFSKNDATTMSYMELSSFQCALLSTQDAPTIACPNMRTCGVHGVPRLFAIVGFDLESPVDMWSSWSRWSPRSPLLVCHRRF